MAEIFGLDSSSYTQPDEALIASEIRYRRLFETAKDGILILDADTGTIVDVNSFLIDLLRSSRNEFLGKKVWELGFFKDIIATQIHFAELQSRGYVRYEDVPLEATDGRRVDVEFVSNVYEEDHQNVIQCNIRDITKRKLAEKTLRKTTTLLQSTFAAIHDLVTVHDKGLHVILSNWHGREYITEEERRSKPHCYACYMHRDKPCEPCPTLEVFRTGQPMVMEVDNSYTGRILEVSAYPITGVSGNVELVTEHVKDMTERKQAEQLLKESKEQYRILVDNANEAIVVAQDGYIKFVNRTTLALFSGYSELELTSRAFTDFVHSDDRARMVENFTKRLKGESLPPRHQYRLIMHDGVIKWAEIGTALIEWKGRPATLNFITDITERKQSEEALKESEEKFRNLADQSPNIIFIHSGEKIVYVNQKAVQMMGYLKEELYSPEFKFLDLIAPEFQEQMKSSFSEHMKGKDVSSIEYAVITKDGKRIDTILATKLIDYGKQKAILGTITDISGRKRVEQALKQSEEKYRLITQNMSEMVILLDLENKPTFISPSFQRIRGFTLEEIRTLQPEKNMKPASWDLFLKTRAEELTPERLADKKCQISFKLDSELYRKDGSSFWVEDTYNLIRKEDGTPSALMVVSRDVSERKAAEKKRIKAMDDTIKVLAMTVEVRDPYTAGHQQKVSSLAESIAIEMRLPEEQIEGIRIAGIVHDIGKMYIPSEILSKPGHLSEIEFSMIKTHPQAGYNILKLIEFPWPVAKTVLQHHERMDGSGYPGHLLGKDIILEARILAVADVVEAMSSHRPYRPAIGIDKALEEISQNKGVLYDSEVVDACLKLFNEKGFKFDGEIQVAIGSPLKIG